MVFSGKACASLTVRRDVDTPRAGVHAKAKGKCTDWRHEDDGYCTLRRCVKFQPYGNWDRSVKAVA